MTLTKNEVEKLIDKLRRKYTDYSEKFNPTWFDRDAFEERLSMARRNRMDLQGFVLAEITNFEKIRERYEKKKNEKSFTARVDKILEENMARIKKYPAVEFHPSAGFEISCFYGALSELAFAYFPVFRLIVTDASLKKIIFDFEERLEFLCLPAGNRPAKRIEDHILLLSRNGVTELEIEKDKNNYLKESAFLLHDIMDLCDGMIHSRDEQWELPLRLDSIYIEESRKKRVIGEFSGLTGYGAILKVREYTSAIISDFRLSAFRK